MTRILNIKQNDDVEIEDISGYVFKPVDADGSNRVRIVHRGESVELVELNMVFHSNRPDLPLAPHPDRAMLMQLVGRIGDEIHLAASQRREASLPKVLAAFKESILAPS